jgi:HEAT repeat protein
MAESSPSLTLLIEQATNGDSEAIHSVLHYLNAANPDLRGMMQTTLHTVTEERLWQQLLVCIAHECWLVEVTQAGESPAAGGCRQPPPTAGRAQQSMIEVFVVDTSQEPESEEGIKLAVLLPALKSPDRLERWAAAYLLGLRGDLRAAPVLDEMLSVNCPPDKQLSLERCVGWQLKAIQALAVMNDVACGAPLIKGLDSPQRAVHHAASLALSELGRNAEPALMTALQHPHPHVRWHAARALGQIGDLRAVDTLAEGLDDDNQEVRWITARVLGALDVPAIPAILKRLAAKEISEPLRQSAFHALNSMYGLRQPEIHEYLMPLLDVLNRRTAISTTAVQAPMIARQLLNDWKNVASSYTAPHPRREEQHLEFP